MMTLKFKSQNLMYLVFLIDQNGLIQNFCDTKDETHKSYIFTLLDSQIYVRQDPVSLTKIYRVT